MLNIVHGGVDTVNALCDAPEIKAISFVGGDRAGKHIYDRFAPSGSTSCPFLKFNIRAEELVMASVYKPTLEPKTMLLSWEMVRIDIVL